jgi:hypothetical protein
MRGFRRTKPRISFALATLFIVLLLFLLSGGAELTLRLERIAERPEILLVGGIFAFMAILLLYEW